MVKTITGTYNLDVDTSWRLNQLEEIYLECDTTLAPVTINLFQIALLNRFWNVKIYIVDTARNSSVNPITINAGGLDVIDNSSTNSITIETNGASILFSVVSQDQWLASESKGGASGIIDIFYTELYDEIINETLIPGQTYRLTNYKSVNFLNGWNLADVNEAPVIPNFDAREIYESTEESLFLTAITKNSIAPFVYSQTYPQDIIEFLPYCNAIGTGIDCFSSQTMPNGNPVPSFQIQWDGLNAYIELPTGYPALFGHFFYIYAEFNDGIGDYYQDGNFEPLTPGICLPNYDYSSGYGTPAKPMSKIKVVNNGQKVLLLDLREQDVLNYVTDTLYVQWVERIASTTGWITRRNDTQRNINVPFDFRNRVYRRFLIDLTVQVPSISPTLYLSTGQDVLGNPADPSGDYVDYKVFMNFGAEAYNIQMGGAGGPDSAWYNGYNDNIVFQGSCSDSSLGVGMVNSTYVGNFEKNNFALNSAFSRNVYVGDIFSNNDILVYFASSIIAGNFTSNSFQGPYGSCDFGYGCFFNSFKGFTSGCLFGSNFVSNRFENNCTFSNFGDNCYSNNFKGELSGTSFGTFSSSNTFDQFVLNVSTDNLQSFQFNNFQIPLNTIDFTLATYVYGNYNCTIFKNSAGVDRLSYVNGADTVIYALING